MSMLFLKKKREKIIVKRIILFVTTVDWFDEGTKLRFGGGWIEG